LRIILESARRYRSTGPDPKWIMIRKATKRDADVMLENLAAVAKEEIYIGVEKVTENHRRDLLDRIRDRKCLTTIALVDGKNVATSSLWNTRLKKMAHVRELGILVIDGYREIGVGRALIDYDLKWARKHKQITKIQLGVFSPNNRAKHLYEKFGSKVEGLLKKHHVPKGKYADEYRMALFL